MLFIIFLDMCNFPFIPCSSWCLTWCLNLVLDLVSNFSFSNQRNMERVFPPAKPPLCWRPDRNPRVRHSAVALAATLYRSSVSSVDGMFEVSFWWENPGFRNEGRGCDRFHAAKHWVEPSKTWSEYTKRQTAQQTCLWNRQTKNLPIRHGHVFKMTTLRNEFQEKCWHKQH